MAEPFIAKKARFVDGLVAGQNVADAAQAVGRSERTGWRWLHEPDVQAALSEAQSDRLRGLSARLMATAERGLDVVDELLASKEAADYVRLGAAKTAIDAMLRLYEFVDLAARVADLEQKLSEKERNDGR